MDRGLLFHDSNGTMEAMFSIQGAPKAFRWSKDGTLTSSMQRPFRHFDGRRTWTDVEFVTLNRHAPVAGIGGSTFALTTHRDTLRAFDCVVAATSFPMMVIFMTLVGDTPIKTWLSEGIGLWTVSAVTAVLIARGLYDGSRQWQSWNQSKLTKIASECFKAAAAAEMQRQGPASVVTRTSAGGSSWRGQGLNPLGIDLSDNDRLIDIQLSDEVWVYGHDKDAISCPDPAGEHSESLMLKAVPDVEAERIIRSLRAYGRGVYGWLTCVGSPSRLRRAGAPPLFYVRATDYTKTPHAVAFDTAMANLQGTALANMVTWVAPNATARDRLHNDILCQVCGLVSAIQQVRNSNPECQDINVIGDSTWVHALALDHNEPTGLWRCRNREGRKDLTAAFKEALEDNAQMDDLRLYEAAEAHRNVLLKDKRHANDPDFPLTLLRTCLSDALPPGSGLRLRVLAICGAHMGGRSATSMARQAHASRQLFGSTPIIVCGTWNSHFSPYQRCELDELISALSGEADYDWNGSHGSDVGDALTGPFYIELV